MDDDQTKTDIDFKDFFKMMKWDTRVIDSILYEIKQSKPTISHIPDEV